MPITLLLSNNAGKNVLSISILKTKSQRINKRPKDQVRHSWTKKYLKFSTTFPNYELSFTIKLVVEV